MNEPSTIPENKPPPPGKGEVRSLITKLLEVKEMHKVAEALAKGQSETVDGCWGSSASLVVAACASRIKHNILTRQPGQHRQSVAHVTRRRGHDLCCDFGGTHRLYLFCRF